MNQNHNSGVIVSIINDEDIVPDNTPCEVLLTREAFEDRFDEKRLLTSPEFLHRSTRNTNQEGNTRIMNTKAEFLAKSPAFQNVTNAVENAKEANPALNKFYAESIVVSGGTGFTDARQNRILRILARVLESQGIDPSVVSVLFDSSDRSGSALKFEFAAEFIANAPGGAYNAGQTIEFTINTNNVFVFLGQRDAALGTMAKNFINGVANTIDIVGNGQTTEGLSLEEVATWINNFRDVFPRLEANSF